MWRCAVRPQFFVKLIVKKLESADLPRKSPLCFHLGEPTMRSMKAAYLLGSAIGAVLVGGQVQASDTVSYTYDALGRLVAVSTSGGVNNGISVATGYDPAGNRSSYNVSG